MLKGLQFKRWLQQKLTDEEKSRVERALRHLNSAGFDAWGLDPKMIEASMAIGSFFYRHYFRVETTGLEHVPAGRVILIANHGGQIPVDGFLIGMAMMLDAEPPRLARGMVERWAPSLPFVSVFFNRLGQMVGDHRNCRELLENDECVLVFPEGVHGSGKTIDKKYELQKFGTGFLRLALETGAPIIPVAVIGCEETYPAIFNFKWLAKKVGAPYLPVTPFFPLLGALGALPLPTKVTIRFGKPLRFEGDPDMPDSEADRRIDQVRAALQTEINEGLKIRDGRIFTGAAK